MHPTPPPPDENDSSIGILICKTVMLIFIYRPTNCKLLINVFFKIRTCLDITTLGMGTSSDIYSCWHHDRAAWGSFLYDESGSFQSYSCLVRSFQPRLFWPNFHLVSCLGPIGADHFGPISKVGCFGPILRVNCFGPDEVHPDFALIRLTKSYIFDGVRLMNNLRYIHVYCFYK